MEVSSRHTPHVLGESETKRKKKQHPKQDLNNDGYLKQNPEFEGLNFIYILNKTPPPTPYVVVV